MPSNWGGGSWVERKKEAHLCTLAFATKQNDVTGSGSERQTKETEYAAAPSWKCQRGYVPSDGRLVPALWAANGTEGLVWRERGGSLERPIFLVPASAFLQAGNASATWVVCWRKEKSVEKKTKKENKQEQSRCHETRRVWQDWINPRSPLSYHSHSCSRSVVPMVFCWGGREGRGGGGYPMGLIVCWCSGVSLLVHATLGMALYVEFPTTLYHSLIRFNTHMPVSPAFFRVRGRFFA